MHMRNRFDDVSSRGLAFRVWFAVIFTVALCLGGRVAKSVDARKIHHCRTHPPAAEKRARVARAYGRLPLHFIANQGQVHGGVAFYETGPGHAIFFTPQEIVLALTEVSNHGKANGKPVYGDSLPGKIADLRTSYLRIAMIGMNKDVRVVPEEPRQGRVNYFLGSDPAKWRTNIATCGAVLYKNAYPGIDIRFYGNNRLLEYDIIVRPGADPSVVKFRYCGANDVRVTKGGDLDIELGGGAVIQKKPVVYQRTAGRRVMRSGSFTVRKTPEKSTVSKTSTGSGQFHRTFTCGFDLGHYDKNSPLVIDPTIAYSTYLGGSGQYGDSAEAIAVDAGGNAYVTGYTSSADFPVTSGALQTTIKSSEWNVFVTKMAASGAKLVYSTYLGGSGCESASAIALDSSGNAYVTGFTTSADFPVTSGAFQATLKSTYGNAFVTKIAANGAKLVYSTYLGGGLGDSASAIDVDTGGNAYVTGFSSSSDFPVTSGAFQTSLKATRLGSGNAFVTEFASGGASLIYSTYLGGGVNDTGCAIAVDASGNAYVTGQSSSKDFPVTPGAFQATLNATGSAGNAFITELAPGGACLVYSTYLGGSGGDSASGIAIDGSGNAYLTGYTLSSDFPVTAGVFQAGIKGTQNAFLSEMASGGSSLVYSTYLGGSGNDSATSIAIDASGAAYVTGWTASSDFPLTSGALQTTLNTTQTNGFVSEIAPGGKSLVYSTYLGGSVSDSPSGIVLDTLGNAYVTGFTSSADFPVTSGAFQTVLNSSGDNGFVTRISMKLDGSCGTSNGGAFLAAPETNLCGAGAPSSVRSSAGTWSWSCAGQYGGGNASCSANIMINGSCGSSNGGDFNTAPATNLCNSGTASALSGSGPWSWNCAGQNGGTDASCSANLTPGGLWQDAQVLSGGWDWLSWFGYFNINSSPWIYHMQHGWLYPYGTSTDSIWFYDPEMNSFWWTSAADYPYVYRASDGAWLYYKEGSSNPRWFYNFSTNQWEAD